MAARASRRCAELQPPSTNRPSASALPGVHEILRTWPRALITRPWRRPVESSTNAANRLHSPVFSYVGWSILLSVIGHWPESLNRTTKLHHAPFRDCKSALFSLLRVIRPSKERLKSILYGPVKRARILGHSNDGSGHGRHVKTRGLHRVLGDLAEMGYDAEWGVLGAHHAGAPHKRDRIWIVADSDHNRAGRRKQQPECGQSARNVAHVPCDGRIARGGASRHARGGRAETSSRRYRIACACVRRRPRAIGKGRTPPPG